MRALLGTLRSELMSLLQNPLAVLFGLLFTPLLLVGVQSMVNSFAVTPTVTDMNLTLYVEDQDGSAQSAAFKELLFSDAFKGIITKEEEKEKAEYLLNLPKGFGTKLLGNESYGLDLEVRKDEAGSSSYFLKDILQRTLLGFRREVWKNGQDQEKIQSIYEGTPALEVKINKLQQDMVLHSKGYFGLVSIQLVYFLFLVVIAVGDQQQRKTTDLESRIYVTPQKKTWLHMQSSLASYLMLAFMSTLFLLLMRLLLNSFSGNLLMHMAVNFVICLVVLALGSLLFSIVPSGAAVYVTNILFIFQLLFGGAMGFDLGLGKIGEFLGKFSLSTLTIKPFIEVSRGNVAAAFQTLLPFVIFALGAYLLSLLFISRKKVV